MSNSRSLSVSLNPDGVPAASEPWVTGTQGTDNWQLAGLGDCSGIYPQSRPPSPSPSRSQAHSVRSRAPWGAGEGAAVLLGSGYRTPCPYLRSAQPPESPPGSCSYLPEEGEQLQPQDLYTYSTSSSRSSASEPCLFLRQSCVVQAALEVHMSLPPPVVTGKHVSGFLGQAGLCPR